MKRVEMEKTFSPRMGWDRAYLGVGDPEGSRVRGEFVDGDKPADGHALPVGSITISGGFGYGQMAMAINDGRITAVATAGECTWWDDPSTKATYAPDEGETLVVRGFSTEPDSVERAVCAAHMAAYNAEERGDTLTTDWRAWPAAALRRIGAWRDAEARKASAAREIKAAKKAAYDRLVREANEAWGRYADRLLAAHLAGGWTREDGVQDAIRELIRAPNVVRRLRKESGGRRMLRVLDAEFPAPDGPDVLRDALAALSGPRMEHAVAVAACLLGC